MNDLEVNVATTLVSAENIIRLIEIRDYYAARVDSEELRELSGILNKKIISLIGHPFWKDEREDYRFIPYDTPYIPNVLHRICSKASAFFSEKEGVESEDRNGISQRVQGLCEEKIADIDKRIIEIWLFECKFPDVGLHPELISPQRSFFLLKRYWEIFRRILEVCGTLPVEAAAGAHPLERIFYSLQYRLGTCQPLLRNAELMVVFTEVIRLNPIESGDFVSEWKGGGYQIAIDVDREITEQQRKIGSRIFDLTKQEDDFIRFCNRSIDIYEEQAREVLAEAKRTSQLKEHEVPNELFPYAIIDTLDAIRKGESTTVEFKSSVQFDLRTNEKNVSLRMNILKSIVAFMNSRGGMLLIGLDDEGVPLGLGNDISTLDKKNRDGFGLMLDQEISDKIGKEYFPYLKISYPRIGDIEICRLDIREAPAPVYVRKDQQPVFYIRRDKSSVALQVDEAVRYIGRKWK